MPQDFQYLQLLRYQKGISTPTNHDRGLTRRSPFDLPVREGPWKAEKFPSLSPRQSRDSPLLKCVLTLQSGVYIILCCPT